MVGFGPLWAHTVAVLFLNVGHWVTAYHIHCWYCLCHSIQMVDIEATCMGVHTLTEIHSGYYVINHIGVRTCTFLLPVLMEVINNVHIRKLLLWLSNWSQNLPNNFNLQPKTLLNFKPQLMFKSNIENNVNWFGVDFLFRLKWSMMINLPTGNSSSWCLLQFHISFNIIWQFYFSPYDNQANQIMNKGYSSPFRFSMIKQS